MDDVLLGFINVCVLKLRGNDLEKLPADTFLHLKKVHELDLGENDFKAASVSVFCGANSLVNLQLDANGFGSDVLVFKDIPKLTVLDLRKNRLTHFPDFSGVGCLEEVHLRSNCISHLPSHLEDLSNLKILDLGDNEVDNIAVFFLSLPSKANIL